MKFIQKESTASEQFQYKLTIISRDLTNATKGTTLIRKGVQTLKEIIGRKK